MSWDILGHEWAVDMLREHLARGEVRHAYLFSGPRGVGRRTLALRFAQAVNCPQPLALGVPCTVCQTCTKINRMEHPDLTVIQSEQEGGIIKIDQVRELQRSLALHPYEANYRVAILLRFEEANLNAMNALLKTLEEPAPKVVLVLTTESVERLLPTIVSRCEILRLRSLTIDLVINGLHSKWGIPIDQSRILAHISNGRPGYALSLFQQPQHMEQRRAWLEDHNRLIRSNRVERFAYAEITAKDRDILRNVLLVWLSLWHDVLLKAAGAKSPTVNIDYVREIERLAITFGSRVASRTINRIESTLILLEHNINARLAAEVLMLDYPSVVGEPVN